MTDAEFLDYCEAMTRTERCGFVPGNIVRLLRLAGEDERAKAWEGAAPVIIGGCHDTVTKFVALARKRAETPA